MSALLRMVIPALQVPVADESASDLRAEVVKEQALRSAQVQLERQSALELIQSKEQSAAKSGATETNGDSIQQLA